MSKNPAKSPAKAPKKAKAAVEEGIDSPDAPAVQSGFSVFNPQPAKELSMSTKTAPLSDEDKAKIAAVKAEKAAAKEAAAVKKLAEKHEREMKAAAAADAKALAKAERAVKAAEKKAARDAAAEEAKAKGLNYSGSMLALRDAKATYVKGANGRLRSTDELAVVLDAVQPLGTVALIKELLKPEVDTYAALNIGQQSMNWRNRLRGAIRKGVVTMEQVVATRDAGNYTAPTLEARAAAEQKAQERAAKKAAADAIKAAKAAEPAPV